MPVGSVVITPFILDIGNLFFSFFLLSVLLQVYQFYRSFETNSFSLNGFSDFEFIDFCFYLFPSAFFELILSSFSSSLK